MCSNTEVLYFGDGLSPQDQKCLLGPVLLSSFKWVLHNMEVISKKYWAFAFKKKRKVQQKTSSLFFLLILSMLWDENHYDKSPFWFIVLFFNHQTSAPFRFSFTSILYIYIYMFGSFVFLIIRVLSQNERSTLVNKHIEQAIFVMPWVNFMNMFLPVARNKIDDSWIDHMDIQTKASDWSIWLSVGMIHVVTDSWSPYASRIALIELIQTPGVLSCHQPGVRLFQCRFMSQVWLFFSAGPFLGSAWVVCGNFGRARKKLPRNGGEIVHYCCRISLLKFGAKFCFCRNLTIFGGHDLLVDKHFFKPVANSTTNYFVTWFTPKMMRFPETKWSSWKGGT